MSWRGRLAAMLAAALLPLRGRRSRALEKAADSQPREEGLRRSSEEKSREDRFIRGVLETSPLGIMVFDNGGRVELMNLRMEELLGAGRGEIVGKPFDEVSWPATHGDGSSLAWSEMPFNRVLRTGKPSSDVQVAFLRPDRARTLLTSSAVPVLDQEGRVERVISVFQDVTSMRVAESDLREANHLVRAVIRSSPVPVIVVDRMGTVLLWNAAAESVFGWTEDEALGSLNPIVSPEGEKEFFSILERTARGERVDGMELRHRRKDGTPRTVLISTSLLPGEGGEPVRILGILQDITSRKEAESDLQASNRRFSSIVLSSPVPIALLDREGRVLIWNPAAETLFGWAEKEVVGERLLADPGILQEEFRDKLGSVFQGIPVTGFLTRRKRRDGTLVEVSLSLGPVRGPEGAVREAACFLMDITEMRSVQYALETSRWHLRRLLRHLEEVREEERRTMAREIHDDLGQLLTAMRMDIAWMERNLSGSREGLKERMDSLSGLSGAALESVRGLVSRLRPPRPGRSGPRGGVGMDG